MSQSRLDRPATNATWINASILIGSLMFMVALAVSAFFEPQWRVLHVFQALTYVAVVVLTRQRSAWGFGAGVFISLFWNALLLFRTPVGPEAVPVVANLIRAGQLTRPDVLLQLFGACGHVLIIVACCVGFWRTRPGTRQWGHFAVGGVLAIGYLLTMVFTVGPPEAAEHIKHALGL